MSQLLINLFKHSSKNIIFTANNRTDAKKVKSEKNKSKIRSGLKVERVKMKKTKKFLFPKEKDKVKVFQICYLVRLKTNAEKSRIAAESVSFQGIFENCTFSCFCTVRFQSEPILMATLVLQTCR